MAKAPNPEKGKPEWWWFRYRATSDWQAVHVARLNASIVNVFVTGAARPLRLESLNGEWYGRVEPPKAQ